MTLTFPVPVETLQGASWQHKGWYLVIVIYYTLACPMRRIFNALPVASHLQLGIVYSYCCRLVGPDLSSGQLCYSTLCYYEILRVHEMAH